MLRHLTLVVSFSLLATTACGKLTAPEPYFIAGGCRGGGPGDGGVSFEARATKDGHSLAIHEAPGGANQLQMKTHSYSLSEQQWRSLVAIVDRDGLRHWRPEADEHVDCQTCEFEVDEYRSGYCGQIVGQDRSAALRDRLESLAAESGWQRPDWY